MLQGATPLHLAVAKGYLGTTQRLLKHGASLDQAADKVNSVTVLRMHGHTWKNHNRPCLFRLLCFINLMLVLWPDLESQQGTHLKCVYTSVRASEAARAFAKELTVLI